MATLTHARASAVARPVRRPRTWPIDPADIKFVLLLLGAIVTGMWVVHGGLDQFATPAGLLTGIGQLTALLGTYLALVGVLLMARVTWIDHVVGSDKLLGWHKWLGFGMMSLILAHVVFTTTGWAMASGSGIIAQFLSLNETWDILIATVGTVLMMAVAFTSIGAIRRRLSYETWYGLHLYAYLAVALAFLHQITIGADFIGDTLAVWFWVALYALTFGLLIWFRVVTPIRISARHRLRVASVMPEASGIVSIYLAGRDLDQLPVDAGQFFHVRFLRRGGWWRPHPFSISAAPNGHHLRLTIKDLGDDTHGMMDVPLGTPVFIEGPYGAFTRNLIKRDRVVMFAGGVGVTPLRAILEAMPAGGAEATLLYREGDHDEVVFRDELQALAAHRHATVHFLVGHRGSPEMPVDPLSPECLQANLPFIGDADVLICGSRPFTERVLDSLKALGVPADQIHAERFGN